MSDMDLTVTLTEAIRRQVEGERELGQHLEEYVGRWVAVKDQKVVADADTLDELLTIIDVDGVEAVLEVAEKTGVACFF